MCRLLLHIEGFDCLPSVCKKLHHDNLKISQAVKFQPLLAMCHIVQVKDLSPLILGNKG
jgi:hypothetical protein